MSALLRSSSRLITTISRRNRRFSSNYVSEVHRDSIISSDLGDRLPPPNDLPPPPPAKSSWGFLKFGIFTAVIGTAATAGYATYAYSLDEIDEKSKALRASANINIRDDVDSLDLRLSAPSSLLKCMKLKAYLRAAAMSGSAKLVEVYVDLRRLTEEHIRGFTEPTSDKLLPDLHPLEQHVFTIVLDLNETLIYSDWKRDRGWRTIKRPGVDAFLQHLAQLYEIVVYSDQLNMYVDPVAERLDPQHCIRYRLGRSATRYMDGKHYRDLSMLNRDPAKVLYISGHALESSLQPENSIPIKAWQGEPDDTALVDLIPFLEYVASARPTDIRHVIASYQGQDISKEFIERSKAYQRRVEEEKQKQNGRPWRFR